MRRVVFDTTVLISAFIRPGGLADELLTLAAEGRFELVPSSAIIIETWRKLVSSDHIRARYPFSDERVHIFCLSFTKRRRAWRVLHLATDADTGRIVAS